MKRGSITVFSAITFMLVASLIFSLLEAARVYGLDYYAKIKTEGGLESACAEFQPLLWEEYAILALDGSYSSGEFDINQVLSHIERYIDVNLNQDITLISVGAIDLFKLSYESGEIKEYQLITDNQGDTFLELVAASMKETLPLDVAGALYSEYESGKDMEDGAIDSTDIINNAQQQLDEAKYQKEQQNLENQSSENENQTEQAEIDTNQEGIPDSENPLKIVSEFKKSGILNLVIEDAAMISDKGFNTANSLERRTLHKGNGSEEIKSDWYQRLLVLTYMNNHYGCYTKAIDNHVMKYELEYVLFGKESDRDNLEMAVKRLLLIREAANIMSILADGQKVAKAESLAIAIGGFTGNPAIIKAVQIGVVAAWAYIESILDLRTLLTGGKIAVIKNDSQWTADVDCLVSAFGNFAKAKECDVGFTYEDYLRQMLCFMGKERLAYRMMDMMELQIKQVEGYENSNMNHMIVRLNYKADYKAEVLFAPFATIRRMSINDLYFSKEYTFSYVP